MPLRKWCGRCSRWFHISENKESKSVQKYHSKCIQRCVKWMNTSMTTENERKHFQNQPIVKLVPIECVIYIWILNCSASILNEICLFVIEELQLEKNDSFLYNSPAFWIQFYNHRFDRKLKIIIEWNDIFAICLYRYHNSISICLWSQISRMQTKYT